MKIGIVIPTYNRAELLIETVESALAQTYPATEIVLVDDGSTDDTAERMQGYRKRGVRYVYQTNAHLSAARNTGLASLSPEIGAVLFLDSDDRLLPDALSRLAQTLIAEPTAVMTYGRPRFIRPDGQAMAEKWGIEDFTGANVWPCLLRRNFLCTAGCVLLRRGALEAVGPWDESLRSAEDWDMWLRLAESGAAFIRVENPASPVLEYRLHPDSMSRQHGMMRVMEEAVLQKVAARAATQQKRDHALRQLQDRQAKRQEAELRGMALDSDSLISPRHRAMRRITALSGISGWYRRLPLKMRLRMRELFGVDRWA